MGEEKNFYMQGFLFPIILHYMLDGVEVEDANGRRELVTAETAKKLVEAWKRRRK
jgi:hypothetical protein